MKRIFLAVIASMAIYCLNAQGEGTNYFYLSGNIEGCQFDTLVIAVNQFGVLRSEGRRYNVITNGSGDFGITVPLATGEGNLLGSLSIKKGEAVNPIVVNAYLVENHDSLFIAAVQKDGKFDYSLKGNRTTKYACDSKIEGLFQAFANGLKQIQSDDANCVRQLARLCASYRQQLLAVLYSYKNKISPALYLRHKVDILGSLYSYSRMYDLLHTAVLNEKLQVAAVQFFNSIPAKQPSFSEKTILLSPNYRYYLIARAKFEWFLKHKKDAGYRDVYEEIKNQPPGMVRDILLVDVLKTLDVAAINESARSDIAVLWKEIASHTKMSFIEAYAAKKAIYRSRGSEIVNFRLEDSTGRYVDLAKFRGKVVMVVCWFTGCGSCIKHNKKMSEKVYPVFSNDTNVVFISVNADKEKAFWLNSLHGGRYTSPHNINLFSGGLGFDHPFLKYYEFERGDINIVIGKDGLLYAVAGIGEDEEYIVTNIQSAENETH